MWQATGLLTKVSPEHADSVNELAQSTMRSLLTVMGIAYLAWFLAKTGVASIDFVTRIVPVTIVLLLTWVATTKLLAKHFYAACASWHLGLMLAITLAIYVFELPQIGFFYALLPLTCMVVMGRPSGLVMLCCIVGASLWLSTDAAHGILPQSYATQLIAAAVVSSIVGWASSRAFGTLTHWSLFALRTAQENVEETRARRAELARVLKDLDQAYYRLGRANASLTAAWRAAEESERARAEFATNLSHELRTPLNLVIGFSEMVLTAPESYGGQEIPGVYRSDLTAIWRSARHLLAMVNDVLDLARIDALKVGLVKEEIRIDDLVREAIDMVSEYVTSKGLDLRYETEDAVPSLWIDRLRIRQVLLNLLVNAARFTESGSITVMARTDGDEAVIRVTDTGRGIPSDDLPGLFEQFESVEESPIEGWSSGTGLGLPISKRLVELHQGRMGVESTYLSGTTIWFTLPLGGPSAEGPKLSRAARPRPTRRLGAAERIVVSCYRDPRAGAALTRYLSGYRVIPVTTIQQAIETAAEMEAVALVTDMRQIPADPDNLFCVTCDLPTMQDAAHAIGAQDYLVKPVSHDELWNAIERLGRPVARALVADDDPDVVRLFRRMLRTNLSARDCLEAYDGQEALGIIRSEHPDVVLLDLAMPHLNGQQVIAEMAAESDLADIAVIVVSARGEQGLDMRLRRPLEIRHPQGLRVGEAVRALGAALDALTPGWQ